MAKKKKGKGGKKKNSASVKQSRPAANKTATRNTAAKPKTTYKKGSKRNSASRSWLPNPFGALKSIDLQTALGVGGGVLAGKATDIIMPAREWAGIGLQGGLALVIAYFAGKSKLGAGVALGLAGIALYNATNKFSNNAIENAVLGTVQRFRPVAALPPASNGVGMSGLVSVPAGFARYSG